MSEKLARRFHELYGQLAPSFGYETRKETRAFNPLSANARLMIAVTNALESEFAGDALLRAERDNYKRSVENAHAALDYCPLLKPRNITHQGLTPRIKSLIARSAPPIP